MVSLGTGELTRSLSLRLGPQDWGLREWIWPHTPILSVMFDGMSDTVDYQLTQLLDEDLYFRFQPKLDLAKDDMDDASAREPAGAEAAGDPAARRARRRGRGSSACASCSPRTPASGSRRRSRARGRGPRSRRSPTSSSVSAARRCSTAATRGSSGATAARLSSSYGSRGAVVELERAPTSSQAPVSGSGERGVADVEPVALAHALKPAGDRAAGLDRVLADVELGRDRRGRPASCPRRRRSAAAASGRP